MVDIDQRLWRRHGNTALTRKSRGIVVSTADSSSDDFRQINYLFWRRGLVVSPSAFQEPSHAQVRARRKQSHLRQFDFDGLGAIEKRRTRAAHCAQVEELCQAGPHD